MVFRTELVWCIILNFHEVCHCQVCFMKCWKYIFIHVIIWNKFELMIFVKEYGKYENNGNFKSYDK